MYVEENCIWKFRICSGELLEGQKQRTDSLQCRMTHTIYIALVDNRWEIANYKALTWIKCTLQLAAMALLNDLLNFLKSQSLCKAIHLSWADIQRKTWFFYKLKHKAVRMWKQKKTKTETCGYVRASLDFCACLCTFDICLCSLPKSNLPFCYGVQTNSRWYRTAYSITQCRRSRWIMSVSHLNAILFRDCDIELTHNLIMAAI